MGNCMGHKQHQPQKSNNAAFDNGGAISVKPARRTQTRKTHAPLAYRALYDYDSDEPGQLTFRKDDTLIVTGSSDRFTLIGHVQGQRTEGTFPKTYAQISANPPARGVVSPTTAHSGSAHDSFFGAASDSGGGLRIVPGSALSASSDDDHDDKRASNFDPRTLSRPKKSNTKEASPPKRKSKVDSFKKKQWNPSLVPKKSALKHGGNASPRRSKPRRRPRGISFSTSADTVAYTHHRTDYDRAADFNPMEASVEWEREEEEEKTRQLQYRWFIMERDLPPGTKCEERATAERLALEEKERADLERAERRRKFKEKRNKQKDIREKEVSMDISGAASGGEQQLSSGLSIFMRNGSAGPTAIVDGISDDELDV
eukprot:m.1254405 g.1254405  ORF g.1254405 m.1254405 type:complete len:371 (+) comp24708_c1_seq6:341-1453(+)